MNRQIQKEETKQTIIATAMTLFAQQSYEKTSINMICKEANLSKGIIYHHFKDKDQLYLTCLELAISDFQVEVLEQFEIKSSLEESLEYYFNLRKSYFDKRSVESGVYWFATNYLPNHLKEEFKESHQDVVKRNRLIFISMLEGNQLQDGLNIESAIEYFEIVIHGMNLMDSNKDISKETYEFRENRIKQMMLVVLYGIIGR